MAERHLDGTERETDMSREWTTALTRRFVVGCLLVGVAQASLGHGVASAQPVPAAVVPAAVVPAVAVPAKSRSTSNIRPIPSDKLVVNVNPNLPKKRGWRVKIERLDGGKWRKVCKCRTKGRWERVVLTQPPGKYRARVLPRKGYRTARARTTFTYIPTAAKAATVPATTSNPNPPAAQVASFTGSTLWAADYETGDFSQFASASWNFVPLAPQVSSTSLSGRYAGQYTIPAGGSRSENIPKANLTFREGDDLWFTLATRLAANVPLNTTACQVLTQWKNDGEGSPPLGWARQRPLQDRRRLGLAGHQLAHEPEAVEGGPGSCDRRTVGDLAGPHPVQLRPQQGHGRRLAQWHTRWPPGGSPPAAPCTPT